MKQTQLKEDISLGIQVTIMASQLQFLKGLLRKGGAPNEVRILASKVVLSDKRCVPWEKKILSERIKLKQNKIRKVKFKWGRQSLKIRKVLSQEQTQVYQS